MADDDARIDPRYDPAFQRGFDGQVVPSLRPGNAGVLRAGVTAPAPYRPAADAVPDGDEPVGVEQARPVRSAGAGAVAGAAEADDDLAGLDDAARRARGPRALLRNPFVIALIVLDLVLLVGGALWFGASRALVSSNGVTTEVDYWLLQTSVVGAPIVAASGAIVAAGLLALLARAWERG